MYLFIQLSKNASEVLLFIMSVLCIGASLVFLFLLPETSRIFGKNGISLRILKVLVFSAFVLFIIEITFFISKLNSISPNVTIFFQFIILIIVFLWLIRRYILLNLIKKNLIRIRYKTYLILKKSLGEILTVGFFLLFKK